MALSELLFSLPTERLREIVERRAHSVRGVPRIASKRDLVHFLSDLLNHFTSIERAWAATTLAEARVLTRVAAKGGRVRLADLEEGLEASTRCRLRSALDGLERLGLAVLTREPDPHVVLPKSVQQAVPLPPSLRITIPSLSSRLDATTIERIWESLGLRQEGTGRTRLERCREIAGVLTCPDRVAGVLESLPERAVQLLESIIRAGGARSLHEIALEMDGRQRTQVLSCGWSPGWVHGKPRNPLEELLVRGLIVLERSTAWGDQSAVVPGDVLAALRGGPAADDLVPLEPAWTLAPAGEVRPQAHGALLRDVAYLQGFLGRTDAARTGTGNVHRNALKALAQGLSVPTLEYAQFVYAVARDADLIAPQGRKNLYGPGAAWEEWLADTWWTRLEALRRAWAGTLSFAEPYACPLTDNKSWRNRDLVDELRSLVLGLLAEAAREHPDSCVSVESLAAKAAFRRWSLVASVRRGLLEAAFEESEGRFTDEDVIERIACGSLHWLGLTEIVPAEGSARPWVRLSPLGRSRILGEPLPEEPQAAESFVIQPNLDIYAPPNLEPRVSHRLFRIAEPSAGGMLALRKETLRKAFDRGETADSLLTFLRSHSQTGVPQNVEYLVREVGGRHGHIRVGQAGLYLQVNDPLLLQELKGHRGLKIHFREDLADTVALITGDSIESVLRQLRQAGYLPVSAEESRARERPPRRPVRTPDPSWDRRAGEEVASRIDWAAIARDDGRAWAEEQLAEPASEVATAQDEIEALLRRAARDRLCVRIRYEPPPGGSNGATHVIEPREVNGWLIKGFCRADHEDRMFNIAHVRSAQITGERFDRAAVR